jgi:hypothetical protein
MPRCAFALKSILVVMSARIRPVILYHAQDCTHHAVIMKKKDPLTRQLLLVYGMITIVMYIVKLNPTNN